MKSGVLLPDDGGQAPSATLTWNDSGKFEDRWVQLASPSQHCVFLRDIESMYLPVAHAEGKFVARDDTALAALEASGQLTLRYVGTNGNNGRRVPYPENPNGSVANVAGICDATGRVFGLMPHPERHIDPTHHPRWTRGEGAATADGLRVFENAVRYFSG